MKKLWAGILILAVLLCVGIAAAMVMGHVHEDMAHRLESAAQLCRTDWQKANSLAVSAREDWDAHRYWIAALVDHEPLEEISSLFSQLELCRSEPNPEEFAVVCLRIASICTTLSESHSPYWWNLL